MKVRIKYAKTGPLKFIGHLDIMRYYQKAIRRANLDVTYSNGFSPHQQITFAAPLALGVTSQGEYFDAEMNSVTTSREMVAQLNTAMAEGMEILNIVLLPETAKTAMAIVAGSDYLIEFNEDVTYAQILKNAILDFSNQTEINIIKTTKKSEKEVNIKHMIYEISLREEGIYMFLATGSVENLKPELVMEALYEYAKIPYFKYDYLVHRLETYMKNDEGKLVSLLEAGTEIV